MSDKRYKEITSGVYCIVNLINGMMYIGSAINLRKRRTEHLLALNKDLHPNRYLQFAYNKEGASAFEFKILQVIEPLSFLVYIEQSWMDWLNTLAPNGYNLKPLAGSNLGMRHSEETKLKISTTKIGTTLSLETRAKMSIARKGKVQSPEWVEKRISANRGLIRTEHQIDSVRAANLKLDKWPHIRGCDCRCDECKAKHNQMKRLTAQKRRDKKYE